MLQYTISRGRVWDRVGLATPEKQCLKGKAKANASSPSLVS